MKQIQKKVKKNIKKEEKENKGDRIQIIKKQKK